MGKTWEAWKTEACEVRAMNKRLIYIEDAIKALEALFVKQLMQFDYDSYEKADEKTQLVCDGISESIGCLLDLPSAQPRTTTPTTADTTDTISRQAAIDALFDWEMTYDWDEHCREEDPKPAYIVSPSDVIEQLPSAQPQRIKGRWVRKESDLSWWYECSKCGESPLYDPYENEVRTPFCPWCGADMRGEDDE